MENKIKCKYIIGYKCLFSSKCYGCKILETLLREKDREIEKYKNSKIQDNRQARKNIGLAISENYKNLTKSDWWEILSLIEELYENKGNNYEKEKQ